ncbi:MAG: hypothetical protein CM1200mP26_14670 [Acidimicrobiales bacterium]|nr:MAG: hypothetical protein CM1200mP26_14670 [Acidimicrobiales bacterium]
MPDPPASTTSKAACQPMKRGNEGAAASIPGDDQAVPSRSERLVIDHHVIFGQRSDNAS